jgi:hypothetical protein
MMMIMKRHCRQERQQCGYIVRPLLHAYPRQLSWNLPPLRLLVVRETSAGNSAAVLRFGY